MWGFESLRPHQFPPCSSADTAEVFEKASIVMQIVETTNEGLKRAYTVKIPAKDIAAKIEGEVAKIAPQVRMPGFRPGKVPANLVRKMHGPALHQEALNTSVREAMDKLLAKGPIVMPPGMHPDPVLAGLSEAVRAAWMTDRIDEAWARIDWLYAYARSRKDPQSEPFITIFECELHLVLGDPERAAAAAQRGLTVATEHGIASEQLWNTMYLGGSLAALGKPTEALALMRPALAVIEAVGLWVCILEFCSYMANALRQLGELAAAAAELERAMAIANRREYYDFVPMVWIEAAHLLAHPAWTGEPILGVPDPATAIARAYEHAAQTGGVGYHRLIQAAERALSDRDVSGLPQREFHPAS